MAKSLLITSHKETKMEFKTKDEVVVVEEKVATVFEAKQVKTETVSDYPCNSKDSGCSKRWLESLSDCA